MSTGIQYMFTTEYEYHIYNSVWYVGPQSILYLISKCYRGDLLN